MLRFGMDEWHNGLKISAFGSLQRDKYSNYTKEEPTPAMQAEVGSFRGEIDLSL